MSDSTFAALGVSDAVSAALSERGIVRPFAVQQQVLPDALAGHDVLVRSPTGSGKTLAFAVPLVERLRATDPRPSALVLAPTRELAVQIVEEARDVAHARALSVAPVYGGVGIARQAQIARRAHVVVATPGRLEDLIARGDISLRHVRVLVLDEADRMLDMGFKPAVDRIVRQTATERQTLLFSATLDGEIGRLAARYTSEARRHELEAEPERRGDIKHHFLRAEGPAAKLDALVGHLDRAPHSRTLVFVRTKRGADALVRRLAQRSVSAAAMHGNKSQAQREKALARFESGQLGLLVATDVAARGIDVTGISHVVNFDLPATREDYVHRVGRTARAGATGVGITYVSSDQHGELASMAGAIGLGEELARDGFAARSHTPVRDRPASAPHGAPRRRRRRPARAQA